MDVNVATVALIESQTPVIISAPPSHDSKLSKGRRLFANRAIDYLGPSRLPNPSATRIKKAKTKRAAPVDVDKGTSDINESDVEEVPRGKPSNSTTTSGTNLLGIFPPQWPFRVVKRAAASKTIVISSDSMSEPSNDDYQPTKESQDAQDDDMDMEGGEVIGGKSSIGDTNSEYEQEPSSRKRKAKWPQVNDPKQKTHAVSSDSKDQASKWSKTVTSKVLKACGTRRKVDHHIPSSPVCVSSEDDAHPQKGTRSNIPRNESMNAQAVSTCSDSTCYTVTPASAQGVPQTDTPDPTSAQKNARSDKPDPHKESVGTAKVLVPPSTSDSVHCSVVRVDSNNMSVLIAFITLGITFDYCF